MIIAFPGPFFYLVFPDTGLYNNEMENVLLGWNGLEGYRISARVHICLNSHYLVPGPYDFDIWQSISERR